MQVPAICCGYFWKHQRGTNIARPAAYFAFNLFKHCSRLPSFRFMKRSGFFNTHQNIWAEKNLKFHRMIWEFEKLEIDKPEIGTFTFWKITLT